MIDRVSYRERPIENFTNKNNKHVYNRSKIYLKNGEILGVLKFDETVQKWMICDYMNEQIRFFMTEKKAKNFIKISTPIFI